MGLPVKLPDDLVLMARAEAEATNRSIAAQVEHWARIGRAVEGALLHADTLALKRGPDLPTAFPDEAKRQEVLSLLGRVAASADRTEALERIGRGAKPIYGSDPRFPGLVVRVEADGSRTPGRFENRRFVPLA